MECCGQNLISGKRLADNICISLKLECQTEQNKSVLELVTNACIYHYTSDWSCKEKSLFINGITYHKCINSGFNNS